MTGFARLLIFLIFILPLAFFGASYINGEDPVQKLKDFTGWDAKGETVRSSGSDSSNSVETNQSGELRELENRILRLERDLAVANEKLARCQTKGVE